MPFLRNHQTYIQKKKNLQAMQSLSHRRDNANAFWLSCPRLAEWIRARTSSRCIVHHLVACGNAGSANSRCTVSCSLSYSCTVNGIQWIGFMQAKIRRGSDHSRVHEGGSAAWGRGHRVHPPCGNARHRLCWVRISRESSRWIMRFKSRILQ